MCIATHNIQRNDQWITMALATHNIQRNDEWITGLVISAESLVVRQIFWLSVCLCSGRLLAKLNLGKSDTLPSADYFTVGLQISFSDYNIVIDL